ncbi:MAG: hypothetical protein OXG35_12630 [Acidobacteria bacterium]|nr:hypothetical protein [Acidobacteriota bacterium]
MCSEIKGLQADGFQVGSRHERIEGTGVVDTPEDMAAMAMM